MNQEILSRIHLCIEEICLLIHSKLENSLTPHAEKPIKSTRTSETGSAVTSRACYEDNAVGPLRRVVVGGFPEWSPKMG